MKIGILTFHCAANYGAVLQAYCLQEVLKQLGHEVYIIDYCPEYLIKPYKIFKYNSRDYKSWYSRFKGFVRACWIMPIRWRRNRAFIQFIKKHISLYTLNLDKEKNNFDAFVLGSDQIWNPIITQGFDPIYLGDFAAAKGKKIISYAASAGSVANLAKGDVDYFLSRLQHFYAIFVRENSLNDYINNTLSLNSKVIYDPVLLAGTEVLNKLFQVDREESKEKKFLLLFQLNRNNDIASYAHSIAQSKGLEMVEVVSMSESVCNRRLRSSLSIEQLLQYFMNASYILTSSFHGTVLALLFNKQFNTISVDSNIDERALSLLNSFHLRERMLKLGDKCLENEIDYKGVNENLRQTRLNYYNLLNSTLSCL